MTVEAHGARIEKVEGTVSTIQSEMAGLKAQMRGFSDILQRIEHSISAAHQQAVDDKQAARINPIALGTVLMSIISLMVGGAWIIGSQLARQDERSIYQQRVIEQVELRQWESRSVLGGNQHAVPPAASP